MLISNVKYIMRWLMSTDRRKDKGQGQYVDRNWSKELRIRLGYE